MADRGSGGAAGEPSVGHQQDIAAEARAFDRARDCEHLPHARAAPVSSNDLTRTYRQRTATNYVARQRSYGRCSARSHLSACILAVEHSIRARCDASNRGRDLKPSCDDGGHASVVL